MTPPARKPRGLLAFFTALVVIGVLALGLSVKNAVDISAEEDARERDRVVADIAGCERGNVFRSDVIGIAVATRDLVDGILDTIFATVDNRDVVAMIDAQLAPLFDEFETAVDRIELTDCTKAVPGA